MKRRAINPPLNIYKKIAVSFIVLTLLLLAVVFYFTLSYAYITIYPKVQDLKTDFNFYIAQDESISNPADGIFQGTVVNQTFSGEKKFSTTGTQPLPSDIVGQVKLFNKLTKEQILIPTTRLLTPDNVLFRIKNRETIPAGGSILAAVYPDDPSKPLAKAGTKMTVPGLSQNLQNFVYAVAENDLQESGQVIKVISAEEQDKAANDYAEDLSKQIFTDDNQGKVKILTKEIVSKTFSNKVGDQVDEYSLKLEIKVVGVIFDEAQVKDFAKGILASLLAEDDELLSVNDQLIYGIEKYDLANKLVQIKSSISGLSVLSSESPILDRDKLIRLSLPEIKSYLKNFDNIEKVEIGFFPAWIKKVPYFQDHIIIRVKTN